jgi:hypothetical protein
MESLLPIILIIVFVATFSYFEPFLNIGKDSSIQTASLKTEVKTEEISVPQKQYNSKQASVKPVKTGTLPKPEETSILINTYITSGPKEGEAIGNTNEVVFEFEAKIPKGIEGKISFETKVEGFDENWKKTSSEERKIVLPSFPKEYTFFVRAKIGEVFDPTPDKRTFKINVSPYFKKVEISNIRFENISNPSLITLKTSLKKDEKVNLTGWQIKGKSRSFVIPQGIEKYSPYSEQIVKDNIVIKQGDIIYLSGASGPLGKSMNFRPNKCMGYLTENHYFTISLAKNCPKPQKSEINDLDICCQQFISKLAKCEIPNYSKSYSVSQDPECISYLDNYFNYGSCFKRYSNDEDFLGKNWHIYMNRNLLLDYQCDTLYLFDEKGFLVDEYSYGKTICR